MSQTLSAADVEQLLAVEYVLGTLEAEERRRVQTLIADDPIFAHLVRQWEAIFNPLHELAAPVAPPPDLWRSIQKDLPNDIPVPRPFIFMENMPARGAAPSQERVAGPPGPRGRADGTARPAEAPVQPSIGAAPPVGLADVPVQLSLPMALSPEDPRQAGVGAPLPRTSSAGNGPASMAVSPAELRPPMLLETGLLPEAHADAPAGAVSVAGLPASVEAGGPVGDVPPQSAAQTHGAEADLVQGAPTVVPAPRRPFFRLPFPRRSGRRAPGRGEEGEGETGVPRSEPALRSTERWGSAVPALSPKVQAADGLAGTALALALPEHTLPAARVGELLPEALSALEPDHPPVEAPGVDDVEPAVPGVPAGLIQAEPERADESALPPVGPGAPPADLGAENDAAAPQAAFSEPDSDTPVPVEVADGTTRAEPSPGEGRACEPAVAGPDLFASAVSEQAEGMAGEPLLAAVGTVALPAEPAASLTGPAETPGLVAQAEGAGEAEAKPVAPLDGAATSEHPAAAAASHTPLDSVGSDPAGGELQDAALPPGGVDQTSVPMHALVASSLDVAEPCEPPLSAGDQPEKAPSDGRLRQSEADRAWPGETAPSAASPSARAGKAEAATNDALSSASADVPAVGAGAEGEAAGLQEVEPAADATAAPSLAAEIPAESSEGLAPDSAPDLAPDLAAWTRPDASGPLDAAASAALVSGDAPHPAGDADAALPLAAGRMPQVAPADAPALEPTSPADTVDGKAWVPISRALPGGPPSGAPAEHVPSSAESGSAKPAFSPDEAVAFPAASGPPAGSAPQAMPPEKPRPEDARRSHGRHRWWALAAGLLGLALGGIGGVLAYRIWGPAGDAHLIAVLQKEPAPVVALRFGPQDGVLTVQVLAPPPPPGKSHYLWLEEGGETRFLGAFTAATAMQPDALRAHDIGALRGAQVRVTLEDEGKSTVDGPRGEVLYSGQFLVEAP